MLAVSDLEKSFVTPDGAVKAVDGVSFSVAPAQCYALLGPSGCGKTSILRCVAGLEQPEQGSIAIGGRVVSDRDVFVPGHERSIGMVFQSYAIWPHLDVFDNVAYPLEVARPRVAGAEIEKRVMDVLALVGMQTMARRPATRSRAHRRTPRPPARRPRRPRSCAPLRGRRATRPTGVSTDRRRTGDRALPALRRSRRATA